MKYPVSQEGWPYLFILGLITLLVLRLWLRLAILPGILLLLVIYFFRNPEREIPLDNLTLVSPADGIVEDVERVFEEQFFRGESIRIRISVSIFDVHVNRSPIEGQVVYQYKKNVVGIENDYFRILVTQAAGYITPRAVWPVKKGDKLNKGERFGLAKFGSCIEIFLPPDVEVVISAGDKVRGGETIVGRVLSDE